MSVSEYIHYGSTRRSPMRAALQKLREGIEGRLRPGDRTTARVTAKLLSSKMVNIYTNKLEDDRVRNLFAVGAKGEIPDLLDWGVRYDFDPVKGEHVNLELDWLNGGREKHAFLTRDQSAEDDIRKRLLRTFSAIPARDRLPALRNYRRMRAEKPNLEDWTYEDCVNTYAGCVVTEKDGLVPKFPTEYEPTQGYAELNVLSPSWTWYDRVKALHKASGFKPKYSADLTKRRECAYRILRFFAKTYQEEWQVSRGQLAELGKNGKANDESMLAQGESFFRWLGSSNTPPPPRVSDLR